MRALRIVLADDHDVVRTGLRAILEAQPGWTVCAEARNGREAVERVLELRPDVAVVDLSMPELNGLEATRQILKASPRTEVLILTMHDSEDLAREVLRVGARGYALKSDAGRDLVEAVEALSRHVPFFTPSVSKMVLEGYLHGDPAGGGPDPAVDPLTPREREVIQLLAEGKSNKEVASALGISVKTAETHRANIMHKLGFHSMSDLVHYAIRNKIVKP